MNYRSISDLTNIIRNNITNIPEDIDIIVGVPRSGLLVATIMSLLLNKPITTLDGFLHKEIIANGSTKVTSSLKKSIDDCKKVLIVEDSVSSGESIIKTKEKLSTLTQFDFVYLAVFVTEDKASFVDIYFEILEKPRIFEWNAFHHPYYLPNACLDIDGVLCVDPTDEENDNGEKYRHFLLTARPKFIPTCEVGYLVTSRLEVYRKETEEWLKKNNVKYKHLVMLDATYEERQRNNLHAKHKAKVYKKAKESELFIESEVNQAIEINELTKKPVYCVEDGKLYDGHKNVVEKKKTLVSKLKKFRIVRFLLSLRGKRK